MEPRNSSSSLARISAGAFQLLVGPASTSLGRADEGAVLDPGDVARVGVGPVGAGALGRVELGEGAGVDQLLARGARARRRSRRTSGRRRAGRARPSRRPTRAVGRYRVGACTSATLSSSSGIDHRREKGCRSSLPASLYPARNRSSRLRNRVDRASRRVAQTWAVGRPMSTSEPMRTLMARPSASSSKLIRWPWRSVWKREPSSAFGGEGELGAVGLA